MSERAKTPLSDPPLGFGIVVAVYLLLRSHYWKEPPVWDAHWNYEGIVRANETVFDPINYGVASHSSQALQLIMSLPDRAFPGDYVVFNLCFTVFSILAIILFRELLTIVCHAHTDHNQRTLLTGIFAFHPTVLASSIHYSLDAGLLTFLLLYFWGLLTGRSAIALAGSTCAVFTKETALLLIPAIFVCVRWAMKDSKRSWLSVLIPYLLFLLFFHYKITVRAVPGIWSGVSDATGLRLLTDALEPNTLAGFFGMILVLNFQWLVSIIWVVSLFTAGRSNYRYAIATLGLFYAAASILMIVRPFCNPRYIVFTVPLMILAIGAAGDRLFKHRCSTIGLAIVLLLLSVSNLLTIDPISKRLFSTFSFGEHEVLSLSKYCNECCSNGRDQLVYNLQYFEIARLVRLAIADVNSSLSFPIVIKPQARWRFLGTMDHTFKTSFTDASTIFVPTYFSVDEAVIFLRSGDHFIYIVLPNFPDQSDYQNLARVAELQETVYSRHGYAISVYSGVMK